MKKIWIGLILFMLVAVGVKADAANVSAIYGSAGECDTNNASCLPIPLTVTELCGPAAGCPNLSSPSLTDPLRFWGGTGSACRTSVDGGITWANCLSSPGLTGGGRQYYAGAADGSVVAVGQVTTVCTIKRSIDNGANWVTVYTNASPIGCGLVSNGGSQLFCVSDGRCHYVFANQALNLPGLLSSGDNGQNWTLTTVGVAGNNPISMAWNGTNGFLTSNTLRSLSYLGLWSQGTTGFPASCATISGSVVYNGVGYGLCKQTGTNENYQMITVDGAVFKVITLPGAYTGGGAVGALAYSLGTNNLYVVANKAVAAGGLPLGIWVSRDGGSSFGLIYTSAQTLNSMTQNNDIFAANGCIYFSGGTGPLFRKIC